MFRWQLQDSSLTLLVRHMSDCDSSADSLSLCMRSDSAMLIAGSILLPRVGHHKADFKHNECMQELRRRGKQPARSRDGDSQSQDLQLLYSLAQDLRGH